jgi:hypothetical protein
MKEDLLLKAFVGMMVVLTFACAPLRALAQGAGGAVQGAGSAAMGGAKQAGENAAGQMMQNMGAAMMSPSAAASPGAAQPSAVSGQPAGVASVPSARQSLQWRVPRLSLQCPTHPSSGTESERNIGGSIARFRLPADSARFNLGGTVGGAILCFTTCPMFLRPEAALRAKVSEKTRLAPSLTASFRSSVA